MLRPQGGAGTRGGAGGRPPTASRARPSSASAASLASRVRQASIRQSNRSRFTPRSSRSSAYGSGMSTARSSSMSVASGMSGMSGMSGGSYMSAGGLSYSSARSGGSASRSAMVQRSHAAAQRMSTHQQVSTQQTSYSAHQEATTSYEQHSSSQQQQQQVVTTTATEQAMSVAESSYSMAESARASSRQMLVNHETLANRNQAHGGVAVASNHILLEGGVKDTGLGHVTDAYVVFSNETNSGQALAAAREARYGSHTVERHATTTHTTSNQRQQTVQQTSDAMSARSVGVVDREVASEYRSSVGEGAAASVAESVHTAPAPSVPQLHNISPETRGGRSMAGFTALSSVRSSASHGGGHVAREADVVPRLQLKQRLAVLKENEAAAMSVSQLSDRRQQFRQAGKEASGAKVKGQTKLFKQHMRAGGQALQDMRASRIKPRAASMDAMGYDAAPERSHEEKLFKTLTEDEIRLQELELAEVVRKIKENRRFNGNTQRRKAWGSANTNEDSWRRFTGPPRPGMHRRRRQQQSASKMADEEEEEEEFEEDEIIVAADRTQAWASTGRTAMAEVQEEEEEDGLATQRQWSRGAGDIAGRSAASRTMLTQGGSGEGKQDDEYVAQLKAQVDELRATVTSLKSQGGLGDTGRSMSAQPPPEFVAKVERLAALHKKQRRELESIVADKEAANQRVAQLERALAASKARAQGASAGAGAGAGMGAGAGSSPLPRSKPAREHKEDDDDDQAISGAEVSVSAQMAWEEEEEEEGGDQSAPPEMAWMDEEEEEGGGDQSAPPGMSFEADVEAEGKTRTSTTRMARSRSEQRYASSGKEADDEAADAGMAADSPASTGVKQRVTTRHRSRRSATGDYTEEDDEIEVVRESKGARFSSWRSKALRTSSKTRSSRPVTAPKPFGLSQTRQSLEATAAALREDRKRREAEEAAERELAKQPFTAKEVPKSTTKPRFNKLMKDAEDRRKRRVQERIETLKQEAEEGAFKGVLERTQEAKKRREARIAALRAEKEEREGMKKFVAKPVPKNVLAAPRRQESAAERKARIKREAADKLATSKLPRRLQMHEDAKRAAEAKAEKREKKKARRKERQGIKAKPVPDFHAAHEKLDKQHKKAKQGFKATQPKPFGFDTAEKHEEARRRAEEAEARRLEEEQKMHKPVPRKKIPKSVRVGQGKAPPSKMTKAAALRQTQTQRLLAERRLAQEQELYEEAERKRRVKQASKALKPMVKAMEDERQPNKLAWQQKPKKKMQNDLRKSRDAAAGSVMTHTSVSSRKSRARLRLEKKVEAKRTMLINSTNTKARQSEAYSKAVLTVRKSASRSSRAGSVLSGFGGTGSGGGGGGVAVAAAADTGLDDSYGEDDDEEEGPETDDL